MSEDENGSLLVRNKGEKKKKKPEEKHCIKQICTAAG